MKEEMQNIFRSKVHRKYREKSNGIDLSQFSMLTKNQFQDMLGRLKLSPGDKILDLGCGFGRIAYEVYKRTGADVIGIDINDEDLDYGREEFEGKVELLEMDYESLSFPFESFDCIYSVDSLYFAKDLKGVLLSILRFLKKGGRFCVLWSQLQDKDQDPGILKSSNTKLGKILNRLDIPYKSFCYTNEECEFWRKASLEEKRLESEFRNEGYDKFIDDMMKESKKILEYVDDNRTSRFMYLIEPKFTADRKDHAPAETGCCGAQ